VPKDDLGDLPYQQAGQVRQLLAERTNAEALGMTDRVAVADKQLSGLGYVRPEDKPAPEVRESTPPEGRHPRHERIQKAEDGPAAGSGPAGRRGPSQHKA